MTLSSNIFILLLCSLLIACGNKGDLFLETTDELEQTLVDVEDELDRLENEELSEEADKLLRKNKSRRNESTTNSAPNNDTTSQ